MEAILGSVSAICCFGVAYMTQSFFPVRSITDADMILNQSTVGTLNIINKEALIKLKNTPRQLIDLYLKKQANLEDIIEIITGKSSVQDSYDALLRMEQTPETKFLLNVTKYYYKAILPKDETLNATQSAVLPQGLPQ
jgi:hypothetical protein